MPAQPVAGVRTPRHDRQTLGSGAVDCGHNELPADAVALQRRIDLSVDQDEVVVVIEPVHELGIDVVDAVTGVSSMDEPTVSAVIDHGAGSGGIAHLTSRSKPFDPDGVNVDAGADEELAGAVGESARAADVRRGVFSHM